MLAKCSHYLSLQASRVSRIVQAQCRAYFPPLRALKGEDLGPTREDAHQTLRVRKDRQARDLPLPPVLDPVFLERRLKWESTKGQPEPATFTEFQKKLQANPYGRSRCNVIVELH